MNSFFVTFKPGPMANFYCEFVGFSNINLVYGYCLAHWPLDYNSIADADSFIFHPSMHALGIVEAN